MFGGGTFGGVLFGGQLGGAASPTPIPGWVTSEVLEGRAATGGPVPAAVASGGAIPAAVVTGSEERF